jgi:hypothetical protein
MLTPLKHYASKIVRVCRKQRKPLLTEGLS